MALVLKKIDWSAFSLAFPPRIGYTGLEGKGSRNETTRPGLKKGGRDMLNIELVDTIVSSDSVEIAVKVKDNAEYLKGNYPSFMPEGSEEKKRYMEEIADRSVQTYYWTLTPKEVKAFLAGDKTFFNVYLNNCIASFYTILGEIEIVTKKSIKDFDFALFRELNRLGEDLKMAHFEWIRAESIYKAIDHDKV